MISGSQVRAARALLGIDQKQLASLAGLSLPTVQRMERSEGSVRVIVDSLEKVLQAFAIAGVELIADGSPSAGRGIGVRLILRNQKALADTRSSTNTSLASLDAPDSAESAGCGACSPERLV
ncbi:helix-turn-helix domain-containing protein [Brevundimonas sp. DC300-4]|uniref:helix-turn-helix domain-containing protein n=1 Tax=Brevundimonas sp. DC300-4 TaxID=2804594 RepID=UPI003CF78C3A